MLSPDSALPPGYGRLLAELKDRIRSARLRAAAAVNRELVLLYWEIGRDILARQAEAGWGAKVIARLAADLRRDFPEMTGLSPRNLNYMRALAAAFPDPEIVQQAVARLPWGHVVKLLETLKEPAERIWYARQAVEHGWSRNVLALQISTNLYARQGKALTNFQQTLPAPQSDLAQALLKDPYSLDFLGVGADFDERALERGLLQHLQALIVELGKGFAFVGNQYHLEVGGQDFYLDLLFYHLRLRCFVVIELKMDDFRPEHAGKMNFYLSAVDDLLRHASDAPSIGIILCQGKSAIVVEYALRDMSKPMGVAEYRLSAQLPAALQFELPTAAELERELPLISLARLRIQVEHALRVRLERLGGELPEGSMRELVAKVEHAGGPLIHGQMFLGHLALLNRAVQGLDVAPDETTRAADIAAQLLAELQASGDADV